MGYGKVIFLKNSSYPSWTRFGTRAAQLEWAMFGVGEQVDTVDGRMMICILFISKQHSGTTIKQPAVFCVKINSAAVFSMRQPAPDIDEKVSRTIFQLMMKLGMSLLTGARVCWLVLVLRSNAGGRHGNRRPTQNS